MQGAKFISPAKVRGSLFLVDYYPGLCITENFQVADATGWVEGEIYLLKNDKQLQRLDDYEGCGLDSSPPYEYARVLTEVVLPAKTLNAWVYVYKGDISNLKLLVSGDFMNL